MGLTTSVADELSTVARSTERQSVGDVWWQTCLAAIVIGVALPAVRFAWVAPPHWVDELLGRLLVLRFYALYVLGISVPVQAGVVLFVLLAQVVGILRRRKGKAQKRRNMSLAVFWILLAIDGSLLLDLHPEMLLLYLGTIGVAVFGHREIRRRRPGAARRWMSIATGVLIVLWAIGWTRSYSSVDRWATALWMLISACLCFIGPRRFTPALTIAALVTMAVAHSVGTTLALIQGAAAPFRHVLGDGDTYSFCERPAAGRIYAAVPGCTGQAVDDCRKGFIAEYDARDLSLVARHEPFSDDFYGRMLHLACLDDSLLVAMSFTQHGPVQSRENVMDFDLDTGRVRQADVLGPDAGHRILLSADHRSAYVVSEYSSVVHRLQLGEGETPAGRIEVPLSPVQASLGVFGGGLQTEVAATRNGGATGFFAEWIGGSRVYEIALADGQVVGSYDVFSGGTHSMAIDERYGRLISTSLWGIDVVDLGTHRVITRRRTEFGPRSPVVDARHGLVFVPTTFGNHVWVFDQRTFALRGKLVTGVGGRNALLTSDGRFLLTGGGQHHMAWDLAGVAASLAPANGSAR